MAASAEVAAAAHRLAGTLTYLGATRMVAMAQEVAKIGKSGDLSPAAEAIAQLDQQVAALRKDVHHWLTAGP